MIRQRRESHVKFSVVHEQTAAGEVVSGAEFAFLTAQEPGSDLRKQALSSASVVELKNHICSGTEPIYSFFSVDAAKHRFA